MNVSKPITTTLRFHSDDITGWLLAANLANERQCGLDSRHSIRHLPFGMMLAMLSTEFDLPCLAVVAEDSRGLIDSSHHIWLRENRWQKNAF
jgi:hypothetical protein